MTGGRRRLFWRARRGLPLRCPGDGLVPSPEIASEVTGAGRAPPALGRGIFPVCARCVMELVGRHRWRLVSWTNVEFRLVNLAILAPVFANGARLFRMAVGMPEDGLRYPI